ncbi:hypothetical protein BGW38_009685 [Lunasporangiospora selenospora]|uniref:Uncharacterized protein n=1 Tax=Lunasporangiospora selenospora TaxID=979761 RepID=A0A9P6K4D1_9FUNG|nr:hypothetical protein BGW38_009685 [Lunasporangiospora selenospora]
MSAPGTPKRRTQMTLPRSKTASQIVGSTPPSPGFAISRRQSTHSLSSAIPLPPNYAPSPKPSFRYIPVSYITPANSEPATPRMSPMLPPTAFFSPSAPGSGSSSPQRPSSPSRGSFSSIRLPPAAAAVESFTGIPARVGSATSASDSIPGTTKFPSGRSRTVSPIQVFVTETKAFIACGWLWENLDHVVLVLFNSRSVYTTAS